MTMSELTLISRMSLRELLEYVLHNPEVLCDPYYREYGNAVRARAEELK